MSDEIEERIIKEYEKRIAEFPLHFPLHARVTPDAARSLGIPAEFAQAVASIKLYKSSRKIERYSKALFWLTGALVFLTIVLAIGTFLP